MEVLIREYELEDIEQMVELGAMMHKEGAYSHLPYSKAKCRDLGKKFKHFDYGNMWVAKKEDKVIGMYNYVRVVHTPAAGNAGTLDKVLYRS